MKRKINVKIHKHSSDNETVLKCVGNMNDGRASFSARDLEGYFAIQNAKYPTLPVTFIKSDEPGEVYHISEDDGKSFILTLEWVEVYDLNQNPSPSII